MLATARTMPIPLLCPAQRGRHDGAHCAARMLPQRQRGWVVVANAAKRGLPLLTAAYKPATSQRPPLCTFGPSGPLKHHGSIP
ncbi:hypothetical protein DAPPUDRAFT_280031 [Daphnia pulex]|uniref:Uncharacterized protein n=1 Tax=Daphnia pulex TaxID=6669 RepID=E9I7Q1_DAPPU|nr:hypothetical protein DAPPUDRAFT_280031 [Daphnia pulex]|eukprot:EFX59979.1 hypothetical protein DAPPUDRAFT_280031 [Daphnia pulex]